jgi:hypothetical protein
VRRRHKAVFPDENPFEGMERKSKHTARNACTRAEAYALSKQLGHPHLGLVPLVCYEWHLRPENVLAGHLRWSDWRPPERRDAVRIEHHKTGEEVWLPLEDEKEEGEREGTSLPGVRDVPDGIAAPRSSHCDASEALGGRAPEQE